MSLDIVNIDSLSTDQIDTYINNITQTINKTCDVIFRRKIPQQKIPWWTEELTEIKKKVIHLHHRLQDLKRGKKDLTNIISEINEARDEYSRKIRITWRDHFRNFCNKQDRENVWSVTNRLLKSTPQPQPPATLKIDENNYTKSTNDTAEKLMSKFFPEDNPIDDSPYHQQIRNENASTQNTLNNINTQNNEPAFTNEEIKEAVYDMNPKKAPGVDHLTSDICRHFIDMYPALITKLYNSSSPENGWRRGDSGGVQYRAVELNWRGFQS
ncbi:uncharacterized protein LOC125229824 [Leguminivora glycinivorella]|uniref:uncharacterized protein LOC125229824 n=1 Tax=Leguminivora glycinivorella TaxID=1035111 RepID=UPI00201004B5|nr:uncharacterized protein LOC125229824 [Leguminivora glycinivorella]